MFTREKPTIVSLPTPPNHREILEDIDSCQKTDPIFELAQLLLKKGKQSISETNKSTEKNKKDAQNTESEEGSPPSSKSTAQNKKGQKKKQLSKPTDKKSSLDQRDKAYTNLIQFTTISEQMADVMSDIEPMLKRLDVDMSEFLKSLEEDNPKDVKTDSDNESLK